MEKKGATSAGKRKNTESRIRRAEAEGRADLLVRDLSGKSRSEVRGLFQAGCVSINGTTCTEPGEMLGVGDEVRIAFDPHRRYREEKLAYDSRVFKILFEDNHLLVIDKAAGYLTMPTEKNERISLIAALNVYLSVRGSRSHGATLVHRLDRDTSGVLVVAKHPKLAQSIKEQFSERKPKRRYLAIVRGTVRRDSGTFESYLATDEDLNQYSTKKEKDGKLAITHYRVLERLPECTYVEVHLETGRRNQIRVHFSEDGHPVLGDVRYRAKLAIHPEWRWPRLALHAAELEFRHPVTKRILHFTSPLPVEFEQFLAVVRGRPQGSSEGARSERRSRGAAEKSSSRQPAKTDDVRTPGKPRRRGKRSKGHVRRKSF